MAVAAALVAMRPAAVSAQASPPTATSLPQWELCLDGTLANANAAHLGLGLNLRTGWYMRTGAALSTGVVEGASGDWRASYRLDVTTRFLLDPFAERRRGFYAGGGVSVRADQDADPDAKLLLVLGVEGNPERRWVRSVELGLGGGVRLGVVMRKKRGIAR